MIGKALGGFGKEYDREVSFKSFLGPATIYLNSMLPKAMAATITAIVQFATEGSQISTRQRGDGRSRTLAPAPRELALST